jgi:hypothetical protein
VRLPYRLRQLRHNLVAGPLPAAAHDEIAGLLTGPERDLFARYSPADQWHALRVLHMLRDAGYNHPDLLAAALLHDVGKTRYPLSVWDRVVIVVGQGLLGRRTERWGDGEPRGWRRPFVVRAQHPAWGAGMAAAAGTRPGVVALIRRHQEKPVSGTGDQEILLRQLQWADDQN